MKVHEANEVLSEMTGRLVDEGLGNWMGKKIGQIDKQLEKSRRCPKGRYMLAGKCQKKK